MLLLLPPPFSLCIHELERDILYIPLYAAYMYCNRTCTAIEHVLQKNMSPFPLELQRQPRTNLSFTYQSLATELATELACTRLTEPVPHEIKPFPHLEAEVREAARWAAAFTGAFSGRLACTLS